MICHRSRQFQTEPEPILASPGVGRYRTRRWAVGKPSVLIPILLKRQFTASKPNTAWV